MTQHRMQAGIVSTQPLFVYACPTAVAQLSAWWFVQPCAVGLSACLTAEHGLHVLQMTHYALGGKAHIDGSLACHIEALIQACRSCVEGHRGGVQCSVCEMLISYYC